MKGLKIKVDRLKELAQSINELTGKAVLVGIPASTKDRDDDGPIDNANLGYLHETGSPANNIPARPFLVPGIEENAVAIERKLKRAGQEAMKGRKGDIDGALDQVGLTAQAGVRRKLNSGDFAPLSAATLRARARRGRKGAQEELDSRAQGNAPSTESAKPLVDTGQLRNAINYVIR